jgi:hypothetical protein
VIGASTRSRTAPGRQREQQRAAEQLEKAGLSQLSPDLLARLMGFVGGARHLGRLSSASGAFRCATEEAARSNAAVAALGEGFERVLPGETWAKALRFTEVRDGYSRSVVALGKSCKVLAAKGRGLFVEGHLFRNRDAEAAFLDEGRLVEEHHIVQVAAHEHVAAVTQSGKLLVAGRGDRSRPRSSVARAQRHGGPAGRDGRGGRRTKRTARCECVS